MSNIVFREEIVTPDMARQWLELNTDNRPKKWNEINAFVADMVEGRWLGTAEAVKFVGPPDAPEKLIDGQNRLHAVQRAGVPVEMFVAYNLDPAAQHAIDSGTKRSAADQLHIQGFKYAAIVASSAKIALRVKNNKLKGGTMETNTRIMAWIEEHPDIEESARIGSRYYKRTDVPPSLVAYTHYVLAHINKPAADRFWMDASEKIQLAAGDPVLALTDRMADARRKRERLPADVVLGMIYRAWNARVENKPLHTMKIMSPGDKGGFITVPEPKSPMPLTPDEFEELSRRNLTEKVPGGFEVFAR